MFCTNCGKQHQDGMKFCPYCGKPIGGAGMAPEPSFDRMAGGTPIGSSMPAMTPAKKSHTGLIIAIIAISAVLVAGAVVAAILLFRGNDNPTSDFTSESGGIGRDNGGDFGNGGQSGSDFGGFDQPDIPDEPKADRSRVLQFVLYDKIDGAEEGDKVEVKLADVLLDGNEVQDAEAKIQTSQMDGESQNVVSVTFTEEGARIFGEITTEHVGEMLAIVSDGVLLSAATIKEPITGGECIISGGFDDFSEVEELAHKLRG